MSVEPIVVTHGGAGRYAEALHVEAEANAKEAAARGRERLLAGEDCEAAAVACVRALEDAPAHNAGRGACMNAEGKFETDAGIMRSRDGAVGAVGGVPDLADPILVAQAVMEHSRHSLLVGAGVRAFAEAHDVGTFDRAALYTDKAQRSYNRALAGKMAKDGRADTVGAVVRDAKGDFCVAGSTGGVLLKTPGRVGDTALVGCGFFASPELGACAATGVGEQIMARVFCYALLERYARQGGDLVALAHAACADLRRATGAAVGVIAIAPDGAWVATHACPHMAWGAAIGDAPLRGGLRADSPAS